MYSNFSKSALECLSEAPNPLAHQETEQDGLTFAEERTGTDGATVAKRFFPQGVEITTGPDAGLYTYRTDHLGSIREVVDSTGTLTARYDYDAWGILEPVSGPFDLDFGYTGHFIHHPSSLHLAPFRAYAPP